MNTYCNNITFTSKITPVLQQDFNKISKHMGIDNLAGYPWVLGTSVKGPMVYTQDVLNCSVCLITDGKEALLMHLNPCKSQNHDFEAVLKFTKRNIDVCNKNLHAILIGSKNVPNSLELFDKFKRMLSSLNIPFSVLKNGKKPTNIAYNAEKDEVFVSSESIDYMLKHGLENEKTLINAFESVEINKIDFIPKHFDKKRANFCPFF